MLLFYVDKFISLLEAVINKVNYNTLTDDLSIYASSLLIYMNFMTFFVKHYMS